MEDLTGKKLGYLEVLGIKQSGKKRRSYTCRCDCGKVLVMGHTRLVELPNRRPDRSCGCKEIPQKGYSLKEPRLYSLWSAMKHRCSRKANDNYDRYGGKGIRVCEKWREDFESFFIWSKENGYKEDLTLDRIDPSKDYSPDNCRWVDYYTQAQNKGVSKRNKTGYTGVAKYKDKYRAYITRDKERYYLGLFNSLEEAAKARKDAENKYKKLGKI